MAARLGHLEHILTSTFGAPAATPEANAADVHLASVPVERIRRLTTELSSNDGRPTDTIDVLIMRLLLNEYASAVSHLRAVARLAAATVDHATGPMREARRAVHRHTKTAQSLGAVPAPDTEE
jgi:hypothetical protein